jgi:hypothetical protein
MATFNSYQMANAASVPVIKNEAFDYYGRMRQIYFSFVVGTDGGGAAITSGSVIQLCALPPRCKVMGGNLVVSAAGTSATASIGLLYGYGQPVGGGASVAATGTEFLSAGSVATAGNVPFAQTLTQSFGYTIASPAAAAVGQANQTQPLGDVLLLTTGGATYAVGTVIVGNIIIVVD